MHPVRANSGNSMNIMALIVVSVPLVVVLVVILWQKVLKDASHKVLAFKSAADFKFPVPIVVSFFAALFFLPIIYSAYQFTYPSEAEKKHAIWVESVKRKEREAHQERVRRDMDRADVHVRCIVQSEKTKNATDAAKFCADLMHDIDRVRGGGAGRD